MPPGTPNKKTRKGISPWREGCQPNGASHTVRVASHDARLCRVTAQQRRQENEGERDVVGAHAAECKRFRCVFFAVNKSE